MKKSIVLMGIIVACYGIEAQENWKPFKLDSLKKNEKNILTVLQKVNDEQINKFLRKRNGARGLSYTGLLSIPMFIGGALALLRSDNLGFAEVKTRERSRFRDGGRLLMGLGALSLVLKVKFDLDSKKYYKKAMEKYVLLNN